MTKKEMAIIALIMIIYLLVVRTWIAYEIKENQPQYPLHDSKNLSIDL
jgi:hypothetical protein